MQKLIPLSKIKPNPFRDLTRYPIDREKVDALKASIETTGFWGNILARENNGLVEIAYGHHRLIALREFHAKKPRAKVELIIRDLDDEAMLKIMAAENMEQWGTSSTVEQETIRSVVLAYAAGKIELPKPKGMQYIRYAPSFRRGDVPGSGTSPYTDQTIADFLGWTKPKTGKANERVSNALAVLEAAEEMGAEEAVAAITKDLGSNQAKAVIRQVKSVRDAHEKSGASAATATKHGLRAGQAVAKDLKGGGGVRGAQKVAADFKPVKPKGKKAVPDINVYTETFIGYVNDMLRMDDAKKTMDELLKYKEYISDSQRDKLARVLIDLGKRCEQYASRLKSKKVGTKVHLLKK